MKIDSHIHIILDGTDYSHAFSHHLEGPSEQIVSSVLNSYAQAGYIYLRDGGDRYGVSLLAKRLAGEFGITYRSPAFAIHREGRYGKMLGFSYNNHQSYKDLIRRAGLEGADFIKLMLTGIMDFSKYGKVSDSEIGKDEADYIIKTAKDAGFSVMAHCNTAKACILAAEAGADSIEHGFYQNEDSLLALKENNCIWVPTFAPVACLKDSDNEKINNDVILRILNEQEENVCKAFNMDLPVAAGSDAGSYLNPHVTSSVSEEKLLKDAVYKACDDSTKVDYYLENSCKLLMERF